MRRANDSCRPGFLHNLDACRPGFLRMSSGISGQDLEVHDPDNYESKLLRNLSLAKKPRAINTRSQDFEEPKTATEAKAEERTTRRSPSLRERGVSAPLGGTTGCPGLTQAARSAACDYARKGQSREGSR